MPSSEAQPLLQVGAAASVNGDGSVGGGGGVPFPTSLEDAAWCPSRLLFCWPWRLLALGAAHKGLSQSDVPPASRADDPPAVHRRFTDLLHTQLRRRGSLTTRALVAALYCLGRLRFWWAGALLAVGMVAKLAVPIVLQRLLRDLETHATVGWPAYALAAGLFVANMLSTAVLHQFWYMCIRVGVHLKVALQSHVMAVVFRLPPAAVRSCAAGTLANLMAVDATRNGNGLAAALHWDTWCVVIELGFAAYFLWTMLRWAAVAGFGSLVLCVAASAGVTRAVKRASEDVAACRDARASVASESLDNVRGLKAAAWQPWAVQRLRGARRREAAALLRQQLLGAVNTFLGAFAPVCVNALSFYVYTLLQNAAPTSSVAFASLAWFDKLRTAIQQLPSVLSRVAQAWVSYGRLAQFFGATASDQHVPEADDAAPMAAAVEFQGATLVWATGQSTPPPPVLRDVTLRLPAGALVAVVGPEPWLMSGTVQDNILFGRPMDALRYQQVLQACALHHDLRHSLAHGDMTAVGDGGAALSGGQRARVALARAAYRGDDVYALDDVLAALDAPVARHVFTHCIAGALAGATRLLVTHSTALLRRPEVDLVVVLAGDGHVVAAGPFAEVSDAVLQWSGAAGGHDASDGAHVAAAGASVGTGAALPAAAPGGSSPAERHGDGGGVAAVAAAGKERSARGHVGCRVLCQYLRGYGHVCVLLVLLVLFVGAQALALASTWWLSQWVDTAGGHTDSSPVPSFHTPSRPSVTAAVYAGIGMAACIVTLFRVCMLAFGNTSAATRMHNAMVEHVFHAPLSFFDANPTGRIMNRMTKDLQVVDTRARSVISAVLQLVLQLVTVLVVLAFVTPYALGVVIVVAVPYYLVAQRYRWSARDLQRLEATTRSPVLSLFGEACRGVVSIRALGGEHLFQSKVYSLLQANARMYMHYWAANQWVTVCLESMGNALILATALLTVYGRQQGVLSPGVAGLVLTYVLQVPSILMWLVRNATSLETELVAVERVQQYGALPIEGADTDGGPGDDAATTCPLAALPCAAVYVSGLSLRYAPHLPWVLRDCAVDLPAGSKVAVIGRTGAGKSSLAMAFLRMYPFTGTIQLGGYNLCHLPLHTVRHSVGSLLQGSMRFAATVRDNVCGSDSSTVTSTELWSALQRVGVADAVRRLPDGLDTVLGAGGTSLSAGEHQLLALARLLLRPYPLVLCDEATASVDERTDDIVHDTLLSLPSTVVFVCHRTVHLHRFDMVVVMKAGCVADVRPFSPELVELVE